MKIKIIIIYITVQFLQWYSYCQEKTAASIMSNLHYHFIFISNKIKFNR